MVNFFGVGFLELAVVFLVAFLVMGPGKSLELARTAGKLVGELRRTLNEMTAAVNLNPENPGGAAAPPANRPANRPAQPAEPPPAGGNRPAQPAQSTEPATPPGAVPTGGAGERDEQQS